MLAGRQDLPRLLDVEVVRRGHMDDVDGRVCEDRFEGWIGARDAERLRLGLAMFRRDFEDAAHLDADPPQLLYVDGADETRADNGRADVGEPPRAGAVVFANRSH